jgi:hypothetical protein
MNTAIEPTDLTAKNVTKKNEKHIRMAALQQPENTETIKERNGNIPNTQINPTQNSVGGFSQPGCLRGLFISFCVNINETK